MKIAKCTGSQKHWYVTTRKPTTCPNCGEKSVRKSIFGYPSPELFYSKKYLYRRSKTPKTPET